MTRRRRWLRRCLAATVVWCGAPSVIRAQQAVAVQPVAGGDYVFRLTRRAMNGSPQRPLPASEIVARSVGGQLQFDAGRVGVSTGAVPPEIRVGRDAAGGPWWLADHTNRTITSLGFSTLMRLASEDAESELEVLQQEADVLGAGPMVQGRPTLRVRIRRAVSVRSVTSAERPAVRIHSVTLATIDTSIATPSALAEGLALLSRSFIDLVFAAGVGNVELRDGGRVPPGLVILAESYTEEQRIGGALEGENGPTSVSWIDTIRVTDVRPSGAFVPKSFMPPSGYKWVPVSVAVRGPSRWVPDVLRDVPSRPSGTPVLRRRRKR